MQLKVKYSQHTSMAELVCTKQKFNISIHPRGLLYMLYFLGNCSSSYRAPCWKIGKGQTYIESSCRLNKTGIAIRSSVNYAVSRIKHCFCFLNFLTLLAHLKNRGLMILYCLRKLLNN